MIVDYRAKLSAIKTQMLSRDNYLSARVSSLTTALGRDKVPKFWRLGTQLCSPDSSDLQLDTARAVSSMKVITVWRGPSSLHASKFYRIRCPALIDVHMQLAP